MDKRVSERFRGSLHGKKKGRVLRQGKGTRVAGTVILQGESPRASDPSSTEASSRDETADLGNVGKAFRKGRIAAIALIVFSRKIDWGYHLAYTLLKVSSDRLQACTARWTSDRRREDARLVRSRLSSERVLCPRFCALTSATVLNLNDYASKGARRIQNRDTACERLLAIVQGVGACIVRPVSAS